MNTIKALAITLLALAGTAALADDASQERGSATPFQGVLSRQAVQTEYLAAQRDGTLPVTTEAAALGPVAAAGGEQTRRQVREEARAAARSHVVHQLM